MSRQIISVYSAFVLHRHRFVSNTIRRGPARPRQAMRAGAAAVGGCRLMSITHSTAHAARTTKALDLKPMRPSNLCHQCPSRCGGFGLELQSASARGGRRRRPRHEAAGAGATLSGPSASPRGGAASARTPRPTRAASPERPFPARQSVDDEWNAAFL